MNDEKPIYNFSYFSTQATEAFRFYQVPQLFFEDERFINPQNCKFSAEAKLLYAILLNRVALSKLNNWVDKSGRVYIICTNQEIQKLLSCADNKATKVLRELEIIGLIVRDKKTMKADKIYVMNFASLPPIAEDKNGQDVPPNNDGTDTGIAENADNNSVCEKSLKSRLHNRENHDNEVVKTTITQSLKPRCSNTNSSNTYLSYNQSINQGEANSFSLAEQEQMIDGLMEAIKQQIDYDILIYDNRSNYGMIDEMVEIMLDVMLWEEQYFMIGQNKTLTSLVQRSFKKLDKECFDYILLCLSEQDNKIGNIKAYLTTALYNAPKTINNYFTSRVKSDMANTD